MQHISLHPKIASSTFFPNFATELHLLLDSTTQKEGLDNKWDYRCAFAELR